MKDGRILFLGPEDSPLRQWLEETGEEVVATSRKIDVSYIEANRICFLISYGYRHIIQKDVLEALDGRAINLHISFLPWNRGADPNLWSILEDTPKGVTIHYLDEGIDTGDIIVQDRVDFDYENDTLATSYDKLHKAMQRLFKDNWPAIRYGRCPRIKQAGSGSFHLVKDKIKVEHLLVNGWDTPLRMICNKLKEKNE
ncbi:MAG: hypothetical protein Kow0029_04370 [Candidatus Rifleibacteriota bacterium]